METRTLRYLLLKKRKEKHLTQQELADKLHVSPTTISKWERGYSRPDLEKLKLLSSVLEIPLPLLLDTESLDTESTETNESTEKAVTLEKEAIMETAALENKPVVFESETAGSEISLNEETSLKKLHKKRNRMIAISLSAAMVLLILTVTIFLHPHSIASSVNTDFNEFEVLNNYHGSYFGMDACCVIVKCDEESTQEACLAYAEECIREAYSPCFGEVEVITIFYISDYLEDVAYEDVSQYIVTLYPLHDFEGLYDTIGSRNFGKQNQASGLKGMGEKRRNRPQGVPKSRMTSGPEISRGYDTL